MIKNFLNNLAEKADSPLASSHWAYNPDVKKYDYDRKKAKKILDDAGFSDPDGDGPAYRFSIRYKCNSLNQESRQKAQIIQNYLRNIGINLIIESCEFAKLLDDSFRQNKWVYLPVAKRLNEPHLSGFDPADAPKFRWPPAVVEAFDRIEAENAKAKEAKKQERRKQEQ